MTPEEQDLLSELLDIDEGLTPWEVDFIEDLSNQRDTIVLSPVQRQKLEQIHKERIR